ncbi:MAG: spermidine/putrescine transport system substrate-binding protein [Thermoleophilaceae bacterium]|nr:spermidine/putrescine transport system substrate-binding protein [Thermoleophilaceae bacterium]
MPDPFENALERMIDEGRLSRRHFVRTLGAAGFAVSGAGTLLAACGGVKGTDKNQDASKVVSVSHPKTAIGELDFSNWPLYIDKSTLKDFDKKYGGTTKYTEEINDNEDFFGKVQEELRRGRSLGRDIVVLTDWMAARWIRSGWIEPIDHRNVPNMKNLEPTLAAPRFDPKRQYTLPWQSGMTAIGYNPKKTGRKLGSVKDLFDPKFKGRVTMLTDWRDSAALVLLANGKKTETATLDDVKGAIEEIKKQSDSGQIRKFTGNDYTRGLASGDLWACVAYSGDVVQLKADNPGLEFLIPEEGAIIWTDNMLMPQRPPHPYAAETMMNFVYDPVVAAKIAAYVNYVTPVKGAKEELAKTDPKLASNELIFPSDATRAKLQPYPQLSTEDERAATELMQQVAGA